MQSGENGAAAIASRVHNGFTRVRFVERSTPELSPLELNTARHDASRRRPSKTSAAPRAPGKLHKPHSPVRTSRGRRALSEAYSAKRAEGVLTHVRFFNSRALRCSTRHARVPGAVARQRPSRASTHTHTREATQPPAQSACPPPPSDLTPLARNGAESGGRQVVALPETRAFCCLVLVCFSFAGLPQQQQRRTGGRHSTSFFFVFSFSLYKREVATTQHSTDARRSDRGAGGEGEEPTRESRPWRGGGLVADSSSAPLSLTRPGPISHSCFSLSSTPRLHTRMRTAHTLLQSTKKGGRERCSGQRSCRRCAKFGEEEMRQRVRVREARRESEGVRCAQGSHHNKNPRQTSATKLMSRR